MGADDDGGTYTWTTQAGEMLSGSESEWLAAVRAGDFEYAGFDASTGLYWWYEEDETRFSATVLARLTSAIRRRFG
ncbi:hypothetical protein A5790_02915 [Mycobacterium sp. 852002-51152_SCH6134967]|nr:hypothetical protein A5790_02915 [Mycobacterium sp. 852002-51152_SCH6134967]